ncbi:Echinoderm microtubule-associated protein 1 [Fasciola gigantica]|uniref:Echinoderm microtubule-associated protein 1 n=1 Tax=Fasciola gigantica TaxID=46835 RepID=A0A504Z7P8_FASGI|nr:Echinoderm microtubule-associated protein 1 [Fasciola gigantica]
MLCWPALKNKYPKVLRFVCLAVPYSRTNSIHFYSIAIHPDRITVATGQVAGHHKEQGKPHVRIWSSVDLRTLRVLGMGDFERGVCCISFSKTDGGSRLCIVDDAQDHVLSVWEWQKARKVTDIKQTGKITCEKPKFILCLAFAENGDLITGDSSGNILVWRRGTNTISQICQSVHEGGIFSLCVTQDGHLISGGGKDKRIVFFDAALNPTGEMKELPELHGSVRTITQGPGEMLLIGTTKNTILQSGPGVEFSALMFGHSDEFWALARHPHSHQFLTAGQDRLVILWDALSKQAVWAKELNDPIHCAAFYPNRTDQMLQFGYPSHTLNGNSNAMSPSANGPGAGLGGASSLGSGEPVIALGTTSGRWLVLDALRHEIIAAHSDGIGEQIECIAYSPGEKIDYFILFTERQCAKWIFTFCIFLVSFSVILCCGTPMGDANQILTEKMRYEIPMITYYTIAR